MHVMHLRVLRVKWPPVNAASRGASDHKGYAGAPSISTLGGEVSDLIKRAGDEIGELHLSDRSHAHQSCADSRANNGCLGNRCVNHAVPSKRSIIPSVTLKAPP